MKLSRAIRDVLILKNICKIDKNSDTVVATQGIVTHLLENDLIVEYDDLSQTQVVGRVGFAVSEFATAVNTLSTLLYDSEADVRRLREQCMKKNVEHG